MITAEGADVHISNGTLSRIKARPQRNPRMLTQVRAVAEVCRTESSQLPAPLLQQLVQSLGHAAKFDRRSLVLLDRLGQYRRRSVLR
jgi:hypothetical protein